jgi:hypothetical protein
VLKIAEKEKMVKTDNIVIEAINFFKYNTSNLTHAQLIHMQNLINAYADLNNKTTDVISRRNMQIKDLKIKLDKTEEELFHARMDIEVYKRDLNQ